MSVVKDIKKCPYCRESIAAEASICKYCQSELTSGSKKSFWAKYNNFRFGFLCGILFCLILTVIYILHFTGEG